MPSVADPSHRALIRAAETSVAAARVANRGR
jgi:hypothetical protein